MAAGARQYRGAGLLPPEVVKVNRQDFVFVDGGITTYNNPAFQAFNGDGGAV